jgi:hypothetical protein
MESEVASMGYETAAAHFIDRDQARSQIETCEAQLKEEAGAGLELAEAQRYLKIARSFYRLGSFTKAFLFAVRARRIAKEKVAPDS